MTVPVTQEPVSVDSTPTSASAHQIELEGTVNDVR